VGGEDVNAPAVYQLFKDLVPAVESALLASIDRFGVLVPVAKDQHGNILDGHQRARLADSLGLKYPVNIIEVADEDEAREIARTLNEDRRAMPKEERLEVVQALREDGHSLRAIAGAVGVTQTQVARDLAGVTDVTPDTYSLNDQLTERIGYEQRAKAQVRGLDGKTYPARREPRLPEDDVVRQSRDIYRQRKQDRDSRQAEVGRNSVPFPSVEAATFRVVYVDPPWRYNQTGLVSKDWGMVEDKYPTMPIEEMKALPVATMAMPDAVLFMWATSPMLADALDLIGAWGFKYKASVVWDKGRPYLGSYVHISHELLLIGTRGSCVADCKHTGGSVFSVPRAEHSRKPEEFRALIDSMYTYGNRIELFRRGDAPEGWYVWGNESWA
jgi:N6-adenosine-specific RNA methylase IME4/transposase-like protein